MTIKVVGIGLDGAFGLREKELQILEECSLLLGSDRHLSYFPQYQSKHLVLDDLSGVLSQLPALLPQHQSIAILVSGDPLFFGLGRLLLTLLPPEQLEFYPHLSSVQLAFSRVKVPWQDARVISVHGRSLQELTTAIEQGVAKIAVLTDAHHHPGAIARLCLAHQYKLWVCENLGGEQERITSYQPSQFPELSQLGSEDFAPLNVVILWRQDPVMRENLPLLGIPDQQFWGFSDRPGLMTKREIRLLVLGELALSPGQIVWDIGAGTGSVALEIARLCPASQVYAVEKTAIGVAIIKQNCQSLQVNNLVVVEGEAPSSLQSLPRPERVFIGGSGGKLLEILDYCQQQLKPEGRLVIALATLEHLHTALSWFKSQPWSYQILQVQVSRSSAIGDLTRFSPLNPVFILTGKML